MRKQAVDRLLALPERTGPVDMTLAEFLAWDEADDGV